MSEDYFTRVAENLKREGYIIKPHGAVAMSILEEVPSAHQRVFGMNWRTLPRELCVGTLRFKDGTSQHELELELYNQRPRLAQIVRDSFQPDGYRIQVVEKFDS